MTEIQILNVRFLSARVDDLLRNLNAGFLMPVNVDMMVKLQKDADFHKACRDAEYVICDSRIIYFASIFLGRKIHEVIPGSSFFPRYCDFRRDDPEVKIFLLGAAPGVADAAARRINSRTGREIVVGTCSPSYNFVNDEAESLDIVDRINRSGATVLAVGVGAPKQEKWIMRHRTMLKNVRLFMAIGATIDFEAGNLKRAPKCFQKIGMEWFYRLCMEPRRLWKRYLIDDIPFFFLILKQRLGIYSNPFEARTK